MPKSPVSRARRAPAIGAALVVGAVVAQSATVACDRIVGIPNVTLGAPPCAAAADGAARSGPSMVLVDAGSSSYCIDTTEVTVGQYNDYLLNMGSVGDLPPDCADAAAGPMVDNNASDLQLPVGGVLWCDAWSYCSWAHKRLCGALGDGGLVGGMPPQMTEWGYACVNGKQNFAYPYGESYEPGGCNVDDPDGGRVPVGTTSDCTGAAAPYSQIHDMVGNVWEFVNDIQNGNVAARGGAWSTTLGDLDAAGGGCLYGVGFNGVAYPFDRSGIRCCADP